MTDLAIIADDLSGAAEAAAACLMRTTRIVVRLTTDDAVLQVTGGAPRVTVIDTDSRHLDGARAAAAVTAALAATAGSAVVVKKVDSLLRGNLSSEVAALLQDTSEVVMCPALPALNRTVVDGRLLIAGVPLADTDLWAAEEKAAPATLAATLAPIPVRPIGAAVIARGIEAVAAELAAAVAAGLLPVCDGRTDADLDLILAAATATWHRPVIVGSAAMAAAAARTLAADETTTPAPIDGRPPATPSILAVVGSAAGVITAQRELLAPLVSVTIELEPAELLDPTTHAALSGRVSTAVAAGGVTVVSLAPGAAVDPTRSREIVAAVAVVVGPAARSAAALLLTGGETARTVLDHLQIRRLVPLDQVHHGAVICRSEAGQLVATRPGSFGDATSLAAITTALQSALVRPSPTSHPLETR